MGDKEKDWSSRAHALMITLKPDTTPERIKVNRDKMQLLAVEAEKFKKAGYKDKAIDEFIDLYYYFENGRKPDNSIDGLQKKVKKSLAELE